MNDIIKQAIAENELAVANDRLGKSHKSNIWEHTGNIVLIDGVWSQNDPEASMVNLKGLLVEELGLTKDSKGLDTAGEEISLYKGERYGYVLRQWEKTSRLIQNAPSLFKGLDYSGKDKVFPEGKLVGQSKFRDLLPPKEPLTGIEGAVKKIEKLVPAVDESDLGELEKKFARCQSAFMTRRYPDAV